MPSSTHLFKAAHCKSLVLFFSLSLFSFCLNITNNDLPLGYHFDEPKKVRFVMTNERDFHHPVLLLELIRLSNCCSRFEQPDQITTLGRTVVALLGTALCLVMFPISRSTLDFWPSFLVAFGVAVSPMIVIHAHYIKEDIPLALFSFVSIFAYSRYVARPSFDMAFLTGLPLGLAISTHYKGVLLVLVFLVFLVSNDVKNFRTHALQFTAMLLTSLVVFLVINNIIFEFPAVFWNGVMHENNHFMFGHAVPIRWFDFWLTYHARFSLVPSMTPPAAVLCLIAFVWYSFRYLSLTTVERLLLLFGWLSYIIPEVSPLKPHPDECRYVLAVVPVLIYFGIKCCTSFSFGKASKQYGLPVVLGSLAIVWFPLVDSYRLCRNLKDDTRQFAKNYCERNGFTMTYEPMAGTKINKEWGYEVSLSELAKDGVTHFALSSFSYDVYFLAEQLKSQPHHVKQRRDAYRKLLEQKHLVFEPKYRTYSFTNPRIILIEVPKRNQ